MVTELQLLNYILKTGDFSCILENNINSDYFPNYKKEFVFIHKHYSTYGQVPDQATFLKQFPDFEIIEVNESLIYLLNELYREYNQSFLVTTFNKIKNLVVAGKTDEALDLLSSSAQRSTGNKRLDAVDLLNDVSRYDSYLEKCSDFNKYYLSTGFRELDDSLSGGIDRQNAYFVISARAGIGKTLVMVKFAVEAVNKGLKVGFYEGEMTADKIGYRFDTLMSHISNTAITKGNISVANDYKAYLDNLSEKKHLYILTRDMVPEDRVTVHTLEAFVDKYDLDILFVDQISLLDSDLRNGRSFEQVAEISKGLKNLQVRKGIPIVVASQQNRNAIEEGKVAGTENIAMSDRISQDASEILFISKNDDIMTFNIAKARDGAKKYILKYKVDFDKGRFYYIPDDDEEEIPRDQYGPTVSAYGEEVY